MPSILERRYKEFKDRGGDLRDDSFERKYGRVLVNIRGGLVLSRWARKAGIDEVNDGWAIELMLCSDPSNPVRKRASKQWNRSCRLARPHVIQGEQGSKLRHKLPRLVVELDCPFLKLRMAELRDMGFNNLYKYPILVLKEDPEKDDLQKAESAWQELLDEKDDIMVLYEVWQEWH